MLTLPVYLRGNTYYFHTRVFGIQVKKSLHTNDKQTAIIKALALMRVCKMATDSSGFNKYKINLKEGILESDGAEDHANMMIALQSLLTKVENEGIAHAAKSTPAPAPVQQSGLKILEVLDQMFLLNDKQRPATVLAYKNAINEFAKFLKNPSINSVLESDIARFQVHLKTNGNSTRTVDNKVSVVRALYNFAIRLHYCSIPNPASNKNIVSKTEYEKNGFAIFELPEMKLIFNSDYMKTQKVKDPDYYWCVVLAAITGCRISEITSLTKDQFQYDHLDNFFIKIRDSKTKAGTREIPIPKEIFENKFGAKVNIKGKVFKYENRLGKGSGNAVSQKFKRHMKAVGVDRKKLVFHSIRKFVNDTFFNLNVGLEPRCYFMGHEIDNVNVELYRNTVTVAKLKDEVSIAQMTIARDLSIPFYQD